MKAESILPPPGVVIHHVPGAEGLYIGSPSITILPDGTYVASHDLFGPQSSEHQAGITQIFQSTDRGSTWRKVARLESAFWCNLFVHQESLYLFGLTHHHGLIAIRRSNDGGHTWTEPKNGSSGLLTAEGQYHTAPVPMWIQDGRIWRSMEDASSGTTWGRRYNPLLLSAPVDSDLLRRDSWTFSSLTRQSPAWLEGRFGGWLEGNIVPLPGGGLGNVLRVDYATGGKAALVVLGRDGCSLEFDPKNGFLELPGGATKFHIRKDPQEKGYWMLANAVPHRHAAENPNHSLIRNTLALLYSDNLLSWELRHIPLYHSDSQRRAFQYPDWLIDGEDIALISRTAWDDGQGGAHRGHDANFLTYHRIPKFRERVLKDSPFNPFVSV